MCRAGNVGYVIVRERAIILTNLMRRCIACTLVVILAFPTLSFADELPHELEIDESTLGDALLEFSRQSGIQIIIPDSVSTGHVANAISGNYTASEALTLLLDSTG